MMMGIDTPLFCNTTLRSLRTMARMARQFTPPLLCNMSEGHATHAARLTRPFGAPIHSPTSLLSCGDLPWGEPSLCPSVPESAVSPCSAK